MNRRAFTIIEILAVIGVLVILLGMAGWGYNATVRHGKVMATRTRLESLRPLLSAFDEQRRLVANDKAMWQALPQGVLAVPAGNANRSNAAALARACVAKFSEANGRAVLTKMPPEVLSVWAPSAAGAWSAGTNYVVGDRVQLTDGTGKVHWFACMQPNTAGQMNHPMGGAGASMLSWYEERPDSPAVLDAWDNVILLVPGGGLSGVRVAGSVVTVKASDGRPFWASAGVDGDFSKGDDNLYSFE